MFVDSVEIFIASGHGGAGAVSFRREKFVIQGGPDGGDGGKGGDIYFVVDKNTSTLAHFRGHKKYKAGNGEQGQGKNCNGKKGKDIVIKVPPGTQVINAEDSKILLDLLHDNEKVKLLSGGKGGLGNTHFKNSINQRPTYAQKGLAGEELNVRLELKLIADIALVGFPNAGKSSLISLLTNSRPKIANYEFTTLIPNLGVVDIDEYHSFVMADIPGLIEGASNGKGLGLQFLQHIERTKILLFMLDVTRYMQDFNALDSETKDSKVQDSSLNLESHNMQDSINKEVNIIHENLLRQFNILYQELKNYSPILAQRPYAIALTKSDIVLCEKFGILEFKDFDFKFLESKIFMSNRLYHFMRDGIPISQDSSFLQESVKSQDSNVPKNSPYMRDSINSDDLLILQDTIQTKDYINSCDFANSQDSIHAKSPNNEMDSNTHIQEPLFVCPISSVNQLNIQALKNLLFQSLESLK